jgi:hypothetical protein
MTKWYDSSGVYVGYSAFYNGAIHYYTVAANGVVTDLGTTKPVLFDTTCCDSGAAVAPFVLSTQTTAQVAAAVFAPTTVTSSIVTLTNPSATKSMIIHHRNLTNITIGLATGNAAQCQYTYETNINGAGFTTVSLARLGVNAVGTTAAVPFIDNTDSAASFTTQIILAPSASITFQARATVQVLNAISGTLSCTGGISIEARGWYI